MTDFLPTAVIVTGLFGLLAVMAWLADRRMSAPVEQPARLDRHIPPEERRLLGDDYRDQVSDYFHRRTERRVRKRLAIAATCGADPDLRPTPTEERGHAVSAAGPLTLQGGNHGTQRK